MGAGTVETEPVAVLARSAYREYGQGRARRQATVLGRHPRLRESLVGHVAILRRLWTTPSVYSCSLSTSQRSSPSPRASPMRSSGSSRPSGIRRSRTNRTRRHRGTAPRARAGSSAARSAARRSQGRAKPDGSSGSGAPTTVAATDVHHVELSTGAGLAECRAIVTADETIGPFLPGNAAPDPCAVGGEPRPARSNQ